MDIDLLVFFLFLITVKKIKTLWMVCHMMDSPYVVSLKELNLLGIQKC